MEEQIATMKMVNDFLERRGLRAKFLAQQVGISESSLYCFKTGHKLLTQRQLRRLRDYIQDYDRKLGVDANGLSGD